MTIRKDHKRKILKFRCFYRINFPSGNRPRFLQLYIYDTEHELQNRLLENPQLHQTVVYKLQQMLHQYNPYVRKFKQLAQLPNVAECRLLIKERPINQPQYNLP